MKLERSSFVRIIGMSRKLKFIQVNIYKGKYLDALVDFLQKEDPDLVAMQEVTTEKQNNCEDKSLNLFEFLKEKLGLDGAYDGHLKLAGEPDSTLGNAVLSRFPILGSKIIALHEFRALTKKEIEHVQSVWRVIPRGLLDLVVNVDGKKVHAMSWHGAWTAPPTDTPETMRQAKMAADYLQSINEPFILGADLNNVPTSKTVEIVNKVATNLMLGSNIKQTTHPKVHKIVPRGFLVDYIFISPRFKLESLSVPDVLVSDHLPVVVTLSLESSYSGDNKG